MDAEWVGTVSVLAGAAVTGVIAITRDVLGEKRQARRDTEQRKHEISERRFDATRDAYVAFGDACHRAISATFDYERQHGHVPGAEGHEGPIKYIDEAQALVDIIGPQKASFAAAEAALKIDEWTFAYGSADYEDAYEAVQKFAAITRRLLKFDAL